MTIIKPPYANARWFQLLEAACDKYGVNKVSAMLGYSNHTGTSQVLHGKYAGKTDRFAERVLKAFDVVVCPHTGREMPVTECRSTRMARAPLNNPMKMGHWRACQQCPNNEEA